MGPRAQLLALSAVCTALLGAPSTTLAAKAGSPDPSRSPIAGSLVIPGGELLAGSEQRRAAEQASLANPEAVRQRETSQTAYENLGTGQALALAAEAFPQLTADPAGGPPLLPAGQRITGFPSDNVAAIDLGAGKHGVVESSEPMAIETSQGRHTPVDLSLSSVGSAYEPSTPLVDVRIPKRLSDGVQLSRSGVSLTPVDASGSPLQGSEGKIAGAAVLYANTATDTDTVMKPATSGFAADTLLRSQASPQRLLFKLSMPDGAKAVEASDGSGAIEVLKERTTLAVLLPPAAHDAAGTTVPVSMSLSGDTAAVTVEHPAGAYQMPIEVDPTALEASSFSVSPGPWLAYAPYPNWTALWWISNNALEIRGPWNSCCHVSPGTYAYFQYHTQGASEIYSVNATTTGTDESGQGHARVSIYIQAGGHQQAGGELPTNEPNEYLYGVCTYSGCAAVEDGYISNTGYWQVSAGAEETYFRYNATNANVFITQSGSPSAEPDVSDRYLGNVENAFNPETHQKTGWVNRNNTIGFNGHDPGIGVYNYQIHTYPADELGWSGRVGGTPNQGGQCTGIQCAEAWTFWTTVGNLPDGIDQVQATAQNATGASGSVVGTVKVDNTAPVITLSGELAEANGKTVGQGSYQLNASLQDGAGAIPSSGLASGRVYVDGSWGFSEFGAPNPALGCTPGPCTRELSYTLDGSKLAPGRHVVEVSASDFAGNEAKKQIIIMVNNAASAPIGPGSINLTTGAYTVKAQDVSIPTPSGPLTVGRSYTSDELTGNSDGLGPQWRLNLPRAQFQKLERNGAYITARENGGARLTFSSLGGGSTFYGPGEQMRIVTSGTSATLTDRAGDITTFTETPAGSKSYVLSSVQTPGTQGATTYTMEPSGNKTRPKQVVAPPPAGVSCTTLVKGCRALGFVYTGARLKQITFTAWDPAKGEMTTTPVAEYTSTAAGGVASEWDPRISPALKTRYAYDPEGHVTALTPPGQQPFLLNYASIEGDAHADRLMSVTRPGASTVEGVGAPEEKAAPKLSKASLVIGTKIKVSNGSWLNKPLAYSYQWEQCNAEGAECTKMAGKTNQEYTPQASDAGYALRATVTASNGFGEATAATAPSTVPLTAPSFSFAVGSKGAGTGQLDGSASVATDASGDVWATESSNNRISEFSPSGHFMASVGWGVTDGKAQLEVCKANCRAGIAGSGDGQFSYPWGIAIDKSAGTIYVSDQANARIEALSSSGAFIRAFGSPGTGPQQFSTLAGLAVDSEGALWVSDFGNNRISKFSPSGTNLAIIGSAGSGEGQLSHPVGIAISGGKLYVNDYSNHRIEEFATSGKYIRQFGSKGTGAGQFSESGPYGIATEPVSGDLYVTDCEADSVQVFNPSGGYVTKFGTAGSGSGELNCPTGIASTPSGEIYVDDASEGRVEKWSPKYSTKNSEPEPPNPGTSAVTTLEYKVPVSGSGQAYPMSSHDVEAWGQKDNPVEATAVFPPDEVPASPAADHKRATVFYLDRAGMNVNTAEPAGRISTTEYDEQHFNPVRTLTPANRQRALEAGSGSAALSAKLDTQMAYDAQGTKLVSQLGAEHIVKLNNGTQTGARVHVQYTYNEETAPSGKPYDLLTKSTSGAQIAEQSEADVRTTTYSYSGQENLGLTLRKPTSVTTDAGGQNLVHATLYEPGTGNIEETKQPMSPAGKDARSTQSIYYTAGTNSKSAACGNHPEWAGLLCVTQPGAQPEGSPPLPVVTESSYNIWQEPLTTIESSGGSSRTNKNSYDAAGRPTSGAVEGTEGSGKALPAVNVEYDSALGFPVTQSTGSGASLKRITSAYNKLAQRVSYTDADGNQSTYSYDVDGRPAESSDGKGTQSYEYDQATGMLEKLKDSAAGTFTASHDADGNLTSAIYPNGMCATYGFNAADERTSLQYAKTTSCGEGGAPVWFSDSIVPSIHGQWMTRASTLSSQNYKYDNPGRLTEVQDTPAGQGCTTRLYGYDGDSDRTTLTSRNPLANGSCATSGGTTQQFSHDGADRLTDNGTTYDNFGNITAVPSADAGGTALTSSYYVGNIAATETQAGQAIEYLLDPVGRDREVVSSGTTASTVTSHFSGVTDAPAWTVDTNGNWTRYISAIGGLTAIQANGGAPVLQLENLHGDVVATAALSTNEGKLLSSADTTEFGVPRTTPAKYAWLGGAQRSTDLQSGIVRMGARAYVPQLGRFAQADPVQEGSANSYDYSNQDPVNNSDLGGEVYDTPYTPVLDTSGNEIAAGYAVEAVEIYQTALRIEKERQEAEQAAWRASEEAQRAEFYRSFAEEEASQAWESGGSGNPFARFELKGGPGVGCIGHNRKCKIHKGGHHGGPTVGEVAEWFKEAFGIAKCGYELWKQYGAGCGNP